VALTPYIESEAFLTLLNDDEEGARELVRQLLPGELRNLGKVLLQFDELVRERQRELEEAADAD